MFDFDQPLLVAGLLLGLSSSLHCFGMCSGIAASLHFAADLDPNRPPRDLLTTTLVINAGRITGYMIAGMIVGGVGSSIFGAFDHSNSHAVLRWAAAAALGWIGLSMLEVLPLPPMLYRVASSVSRFMDTVARAAQLPADDGAVLERDGLGFSSLRDGLCRPVLCDAFRFLARRGVVMSGFGLGTLPVLVAAGLGLPLLRRRVTSVWLRNAVGVRHHSGWHRQRRHIADDVRGVVPLWLTSPKNRR